jgi:hypothetical protein
MYLLLFLLLFLLRRHTRRLGQHGARAHVHKLRGAGRVRPQLYVRRERVRGAAGVLPRGGLRRVVQVERAVLLPRRNKPKEGSVAAGLRPSRRPCASLTGVSFCSQWSGSGRGS